jgi:hypothetical protein
VFVPHHNMELLVNESDGAFRISDGNHAEGINKENNSSNNVRCYY